MGSLNQFENCSNVVSWKKIFKLDKLPSADTMADVSTKINIDGMRQVIKHLYHKLKRNKALSSGFHKSLFFLVIDGHESSSSYYRSCTGALSRVVHTKNGDRTQYYFRYTMGMLMSADGFSIPLDIEMQLPGEGEICSAMRLLERMCKMYPRAFDVVVVDGLYPQAPFFKKVRQLNKHVIAVLKDDRRELMKEAKYRCEKQIPHSYRRANGTYVDAYDLEDCNGWPQCEMPVRVVVAEEKSIVRRQMSGLVEQKNSEWCWVTTLSKKYLPTEQLVEVGHHRWDIENKGFNELNSFWHLNHVYKNDTNAILFYTLMTMISYTVFHAFLFLNLKPAVRYKKTKKSIQKMLSSSFYNFESGP